jgi:hypothetical protein
MENIMKIDVDDAVDRLQCMSREIVISQHLPKELKESLEKDRQLLRALVPIVSSFKLLGN